MSQLSSTAADVDALLRKGIAAARAGQRERARDLLTRAVAKDRRNVRAWLWLSEVVDDLDAKKRCLERMLILEPDSELARSKLAWLQEQRTNRPIRSAVQPCMAWLESSPASKGKILEIDPVLGETPAEPCFETEPTPTGAVAKQAWVIRNEFIPMAVFGLVLLGLIALGLEGLPTSLPVLRLLLGLPFVLFVPGYILQAALFPRVGDLDGPERLAFSFGLSIAVVPPMVLILDALPWGIRLGPIVIAEGLFIVVFSTVALLLRRQLPEDEQFVLAVDVDMKDWWSAQDQAGRILYGVLAVALLVAVGAALAIVLLPNPTERFTEFYVLGPEGLAENYPREAVAGESISLAVGIANREGVRAEYRIEVRTEEQQIGAAGPIALEDRKVWEGPVQYALPQVGEDQEMLLLLYRDRDSEPYRTLRLWINVVQE
jgi:uncharacterized membrane protein